MSINIAIDHRNLLEPARDQGPRLTCLAFALSAAHEAKVLNKGYFSPEYLYYFATNGQSQSGAVPQAISGALSNVGQPIEADCPYLLNDPTNWAPPSPINVFKHDSVVKTVSANEIEQLLQSGETPVLLLSIPSNFYTISSPWVISPGQIRGHHAVLCLGLGSEGGNPLYLIRNSWGLAWGENGHAWLTRAFLDTHLEGIIQLNT